MKNFGVFYNMNLTQKSRSSVEDMQVSRKIESAQNDFELKAPSGRELDFAKQKTEGECGAIWLIQTQSCAVSFRHGKPRHLPLGGRLMFQYVS